MSLRISTVTVEQWEKVIKAIAYSFVSAAIVVWSTTNFELSKNALVAAAVAGVNGALVYVKQLFTEST